MSGFRRDRRREARIRAHAEALGREVEAYAKASGRRLGLFSEDSTLYVIDSDRDTELCDANANAAERSAEVEGGGSVVLFLGTAGGACWSGAGW